MNAAAGFPDRIDVQAQDFPAWIERLQNSLRLGIGFRVPELGANDGAIAYIESFRI